MSYGPYTQYPYDTVVYVTDVIGGVSYQGSGVLISPDEVLTASHVVYNSVYGTASDILVSPAYDLGDAPYGSVDGTFIHYNSITDPGGTIALEQSQFDYAVIHLAQPFTGLGYMGLQSNYPGGEVDVTGYPASDLGLQITDPEIVTQVPSLTVYRGTTLGEGSSGGPVWITGTDGQPYVVGLVSSATGVTGYFSEITTSALDTIEAWVAQDDGPCFLAGTRIAALRGEIPVEQLSTDDVVRTKFGGPTAIRWIGFRHVDCRRHPRAHDLWPVRIREGAFGAGTPRRDLWLSPDHSVFIDDVLIPIRYLVNGATIAQEQVDEVTYWHVELPAHDVLRAEGLPAESYLDTGNRSAFANGGAAVRLHPDFARSVWDKDACASLVLDGADLMAARRFLLERAAMLGYRMTDDPDLHVLAEQGELTAEAERQRWRVHLPAATERVRLVSRAWRPVEMRPGESDTRRLGIAVSRIWLDAREVSLESPGLCSGWHAPEPGCRWTDGDAQLSLAGVRDLAFELKMAGPYWLPRADAKAAATVARRVVT